MRLQCPAVKRNDGKCRYNILVVLHASDSLLVCILINSLNCGSNFIHDISLIGEVVSVDSQVISMLTSPWPCQWLDSWG